MTRLPILYSAHHAGSSLETYSQRSSLSALAREKFSDYGSDITVPRNGIATLVGKTSRALGDLNRSPDNANLFPTHDFAKPTPNKIWHHGEELSTLEMRAIKTSSYDKYHGELVSHLKQSSKRTLVVAWDNTASYSIGADDAGNPVQMPIMILSNLGVENKCHSEFEHTSCRPETLEKLKLLFEELFKKNGISGTIHTNLVFKGGYIAEFYNTLRHKKELESLGVHTDVESLQVEYSTALTHDQRTLKPIDGRMELIRTIAEEAFAALTKRW